MSVTEGTITTGKVIKIMPFGAFVKLEDGTVGLVHISEVASKYVENINEHVKFGDQVRVCVVKVGDDGKVSLSMKKALEQKRQKEKNKERPKKQEAVRPAEIDWSRKDDNLSFEDKLSRFKQVSDENMQALRRSNDSKRSGGYKRTH